MGAVKNLIVRVGADFSELQKEMGKAGKYLGTVGKELQSVGKGMTLGITVPILAIGLAGLKTASDLQEVQNVVDTAFGASSKSVDAWAKTAMASYGLTELQAKQFSSTMRAMTGSMGLTAPEADKMSLSLAGLAGDMASFYNISQEDAFEKIRAGISGETEPLKQLGVNMSVANLQAYALSQGITKSYGSMTEAEKATLRYNFIMNATKTAQGDFEKTSGSLANQMRIVKGMFTDIAGQLMSSFIPMMQGALTKVQEAMTWFKGLSDEQKKLATNIALVAAAIGPIIFVVGTLMSTMGSIILWGSGIAKAFSLVSTGAKGIGAIFTAIFSPAGVVLLVIAGIALLIAGLVSLYNSNEEFRNQVNIIWTNIQTLITGVLEYVRQFWAQWGGDITAIFNGVVELLGIALGVLLQAFQVIWPLISAVVTTAVEIIGGIIGNAILILKGIIDFLVGVFTGDWDRAWSGIKEIFKGILEGIGGLVVDAVNGIVRVIGGMIDTIKGAIEWIDKLLSKNAEAQKVKLTEYKTALVGTNAAGTNNWRGGLTWVGERGPELLNLPRGSQIIPNNTSMEMTKPASITSNPNSNSTDGTSQYFFVLPNGKVLAEYIADNLDKVQGGNLKLSARGVGI